MAFELKILDEIHCPRCNAKAQLRIDQKPPRHNWVFVYIVCPICRLNRYSHTTTRKAIVIRSRIEKLKKKSKTSKKIDDTILKLEKMAMEADRGFE